MVSSVLDRAALALDWVCDGYRPSPRPMALLRIAFSVYVLVLPRDISWISQVPSAAYDPPLGPFALLSGPPNSAAINLLTLFQVGFALLVLIGWKTKVTSVLLSVTLMIASGLAFSYGKVNHSILFDLTPLILGFAGWGSAWSVDAYRKKYAQTSGFAMFVLGSMVAFSFANAAAFKGLSWMSLGRQATRFFVARDLEYSQGASGPLAAWFLQFDSSILWKFLDYSTLFVEGWLIVAVLLPGLFRIGLLMLGILHVGVWLLMGINFQLNLLVYSAFFLVPFSRWFPEIGLGRAYLTRRWSRGLR
jgi:hypothetical protein